MKKSKLRIFVLVERLASRKKNTLLRLLRTMTPEQRAQYIYRLQKSRGTSL